MSLVKLRLAPPALLLVAALPLAAQTPEQIEAEPIVKLQPGETPVPGECITQQELDLLAGLRALRRPTVGVEDAGDDQAPFNPHYFVGTWEVEGVLPESPLGESTEFVGTEVFRHVDGCIYESTLEATTVGGAVTIASRLIYDRRASYLVRLEDDSRGIEFVKIGRVGGDAGVRRARCSRRPPAPARARPRRASRPRTSPSCTPCSPCRRARRARTPAGAHKGSPPALRTRRPTAPPAAQTCSA